MFDQREDWAKRSNESTVGASEHVLAEIDGERCLKQQRAEREQSRGGHSSNLPREFGNVILSNDGGAAPSARTGDATLRSAAATENDASSQSQFRGEVIRRDVAPAVAGDQSSAQKQQNGQQGKDLADQVRSSEQAIRRDVEPVVHSVRAGETLEAIARQHLGAGASDEDVRRHVQEIGRYNAISAPSTITAGTSLILPGHTRDGGFVTGDEHGSRRTTWSNGGYRIERSDGTGYVHTPGQSNGFTERHWGPRRQDNYTLTETADGWSMICQSGSLADKVSLSRAIEVHESELQERLADDLRHGTFGDQEEHDAIARQFFAAAKLRGSGSNQEVLSEINAGLERRQSQYRVSAGYFHSSGRHLEIRDGQGRLTDSFDFEGDWTR